MTDKPLPQPAKSRRGFAAMYPTRQREIASRGGRAAHERGTAHEFSPEEARRAGQRGGEVVSRDRQHMASIGSRGGRNRGNGSTAHTTPLGAEQPEKPIGDVTDGRNGTIDVQTTVTAHTPELRSPNVNKPVSDVSEQIEHTDRVYVTRDHQTSAWNEYELQQPIRRTPRARQTPMVDLRDDDADVELADDDERSS